LRNPDRRDSRAILATFAKENPFEGVDVSTLNCFAAVIGLFLNLVGPHHCKGIFMLKFAIVGTGLLAMVGVAAAADLPRPQPVYQEAPVGKAPIGKGPIGKGPIGKGPVGPPIITKG
jgi:hypothetical protein